MNIPDDFLKPGDKGDNVKALQEALTDIGLLNSGHVDGIYGKQTEAAIKQLQSQSRKPADGIYGPTTKPLLQNRLELYMSARIAFLELNVFLADDVWGSTNQSRRFLFEMYWFPQRLETVQSEWIKVGIGDLLILKHQQSTNQLRVSAIGLVINKDNEKLWMNWVKFDRIILITEDRIYQNPLAYLPMDLRKPLFGQFERSPDYWNIFHELRSLLDDAIRLVSESKPVKRTYRLSQVARKLNTSITEVVALLSEKGFKINLNPNEKINDELYQLLREELGIGNSNLKSAGAQEKIEELQQIIKTGIESGDSFWWYNHGSENMPEDSIHMKLKPQKIPLKLNQLALCISPKTDLIGMISISSLNERSSGEITDLTLKPIYKFNTTTQKLRDFLQSKEFDGYKENWLNVIEPDIFSRITNSTELAAQLTFVNEQRRTQIDNDVAFVSRDLLDIENDVRAFALLLASKDVKPPLAVALFGKWGSGKSFFMKHLTRKVSELSEYQGFLRNSDSIRSENSDILFCKGIAQIEFNAWSYLDSNLWAGLVTSIFEKLDEFIIQTSKGEEEKLKIRKKLSDKLHVLSSEKHLIKIKREDLIIEKDNLDQRLRTLKGEKEQIIKNIADKKLDDLIRVVRERIPLESSLKKNLAEYGFTEERIASLNPTSLNEEVRSWVSFVRNIFQFSASYILLFTVCVLLVALALMDPNALVSRYVDMVGRQFTILLGIAGPIFIKWYDSFSRFKRLVEPLANYKNSYNNALEEAKFKYQQEIDLLQSNIASKDFEISEAQKEIETVERKILDVEYTLDHFVAKRAFNDFVRRKISEKQYDSHLGLISIIRRDFETLSDLFTEIDIDNTAPKEIQEKQRELKKEHDEIVKLFKGERILDRIILYIDDLDRCSDEKVLEVIQAVHLLMAFPLFNVVVGVDKRCVRNALLIKTKLEYRKIAPMNEIIDLGLEVITPEEYLEKIFQIPFELKEADNNEVSKMVNGLLENYFGELEADIEESDRNEKQLDKEEPKLQSVQIGEVEFGGIEYGEKRTLLSDEIQDKLVSSAPDQLKLTNSEVKELPMIMNLVGNTPRTIKRFLNIYRIVRSHAVLKYEERAKDDVFLFIMFLLAVGLGKYRYHSKSLFNILQYKKRSSISSCLKEVNGLNSKAIIEEIEGKETISRLLKFKSQILDEEIIPFITRFSFEKSGVLQSSEEL